jgi:hypothetical protein
MNDIILKKDRGFGEGGLIFADVSYRKKISDISGIESIHFPRLLLKSY